ncbi:MAG TPA: hypothetical protein VJM32_06135 [Candidatus Saccharimonadales bacterium]|nr:hypothetical protein [Candidatus Saccharimonadales bacterium]
MQKPAGQKTARAILGTLFVGVFAVLAVPDIAYALSSGSYQIQEDFVGGGGNTRSASSSYISQDAIGGAAAGDGSGTAYRTQSGSQTTSDPTLSMSVDTASVNLGALSTSLTRTGTATFSVLNYTSYGYIVQTIGNPPDNGVHTLTGLASQAASATNTEQFGINLKANTAPTTFGAEPLEVPDNTFSFGVAATGYNTANQYKYVAGNTIASAPKSSGKTTYTISYIVNISNNTPGGSYSGKQTLVVVGTY